MYPLLHVSQLASLLDLPGTVAIDASRLSWDLAAILESWQDHLRLLDLEDMTRPTPSRGRSLRNLTVNTFNPIGLLPGAWVSREFDWDPDLDDALEAQLETRDALISFGDERLYSWREFLLEKGAEIDTDDPTITSPRGKVTYTELVASQRWHAAFHYRQLRAFVELESLPSPGSPYSLAGLKDLDLPAEVF